MTENHAQHSYCDYVCLLNISSFLILQCYALSVTRCRLLFVFSKTNLLCMYLATFKTAH